MRGSKTATTVQNERERDFWANLDISDISNTSVFPHQVSFQTMHLSQLYFQSACQSILLTASRNKQINSLFPYQVLMKQYIAKGAFQER